MHEILTIVAPVVVAHLVVLVLLVVIIRQLLLGDAKRAIARINEVEAEVRKKEESIRREIEDHEKDFLQRKADAETEMQRRKEVSEKEVAELKEQMVADAKTESSKIIEQARKNEAKFRAQIAEDMEEKAVKYGVDVFRLVFSDRMSKQLHRQFMDELLDALADIEGASITVDGEEAEFVAGQPLEEDQKTRFQSLLKEKFGVEVEVKEKVDHELLAGMVFKLGSLEIDGSLRNRYNEAADEVQKSAHHATAEV